MERNFVQVPPYQRELLPEIIILHDRLVGRRDDRYMLNFAECLGFAGFRVNVITTEIDETSHTIRNITLNRNITFESRLSWIPRSIFGYFKSALSIYSDFCLALSIILRPPTNEPAIILMDTDSTGLCALKLLSYHKVLYIEKFRCVRNSEISLDLIDYIPSLFTAEWIKSADEVIVGSPIFFEVLQRNSFVEDPVLMMPLVDCGLWTEPLISIYDIVPDWNDNSLLFLCTGEFVAYTNFELALESFKYMLEFIASETALSERAYLIIAGNCDSPDEREYYLNMIKDLSTEWFAGKVTVVTHLPTIHITTLLMKAHIFLYTSRELICSDYLVAAMKMGKPIIAVNSGIASKLLETNVTGMLVEPHPIFFCMIMIKLARSEKLRSFLGGKAQNTFRRKYSRLCFTRKICRLVHKHMASLYEN